MAGLSSRACSTAATPPARVANITPRLPAPSRVSAARRESPGAAGETGRAGRGARMQSPLPRWYGRAELDPNRASRTRSLTRCGHSVRPYVPGGSHESAAEMSQIRHTLMDCAATRCVASVLRRMAPPSSPPDAAGPSRPAARATICSTCTKSRDIKGCVERGRVVRIRRSPAQMGVVPCPAVPTPPI